MVAASTYSELFGIPVAGFGLFFYSINLFILNLLKESKEKANTWSLLKLLSLIGIIPTIILASISIIIIKSICVVCFTSYVCSVGLGAIAFRLEAANDNFVTEGSKRFVSLIKNNVSVLLSFVFIGVLSLLAPLIVIKAYHQNAPSLEASNDTRAIDLWSNAKPSPASVVLVNEGPDRDVIFGSPDSSVTVISYSDMACPHCKVIASVLHQLSHKYKFRLIFKDYPLDQHCNPLITRAFHDYSCQAAKISRCALLTSQKLYSEVHESIYSLVEVDTQSLKPISDLVNASSGAAAECVKETGYPQSITRHLQEGASMKIPGTPAIFVNGKMVPVPTPTAIEKIIELAMRGR